jgi:hypothetical protein
MCRGGAGIAQWYSAGLWADWTVVRVPAGAGNFSLHHRVQTGSGAHPASYPVGTRGFSPGSKAAGGVKLITHLHLMPRSRMRGAIPPLSQYAFMALGSVKSTGTTLPLPLYMSWSQVWCYTGTQFTLCTSIQLLHRGSLYYARWLDVSVI